MLIKYKGKRGKKIVKSCEQCNCDFETLEFKAKRGEERFCSRSCYDKNRKENKQDKKLLNRLYQKKFKYGLSKEQYFGMYKIQDHKCAICKRNEGEAGRLCVDHCHTTEKVRGLLCNDCNKLLGNAKDSTEILKEAILYLGSSSNGQDTTLIQS